MFRVCSDSPIGLRVISELHLEWVRNSCARVHEHSRHDTTFACLNIAALSAPNYTTIAHTSMQRTKPIHFPIEINFVTVAPNVILYFIFFVRSKACCELSCVRFCMWSRGSDRNPEYALAQFSIGSNTTTITNVAKWMPAPPATAATATCIQ